MLSLILVIIGTVFALSAASILVIQQYRIKKGKIVVDPDFSGPEHVSTTVNTIIRYLLKRSVHLRKFCMQYVLHIMVRGMYHFDVLTTKMYALSRNWFVKNAVKNKGTVPHFWEHLKVYKQEMDKEKKEEDIK